MERQTASWFIPILLAIGAAGALWYYWFEVDEPVREPQLPAQPVTEEPQAILEPLHPIPEQDLPASNRPELRPLPPLDQSDDYFALALTDLFGESIEVMFANSGIIERIVATVDNLARPQLAERMRPVGKVGGQFVVDGQDASGEFAINNSNYGRYDSLVDLITGADLTEIADVYRRFYPLFQSTYVDLGYPGGYFNDRLVEVIDHLLATPDIEDPIALARPNVLYEFADPELEGLSSGQKLLLRMGSAHRSNLKQTLREFRNIVTQM